MDLSKHDCISNPEVQPPGTWRFKRNQTEYVVPVRSRLVVSNLESTCDAARSGLGITVAFSYQVAEAIKSGELTPLLQDFQPPSQPISFVYLQNRFMPAKLRAFLDFAQPRLRARLGDLSGCPTRTDEPPCLSTTKNRPNPPIMAASQNQISRANRVDGSD